MQIQTRSMYDYNHSQMMMSSSASSPPTLGYIQHPISKLDTLAGIAIKYGVEVADIKKMNGLVTDSQMFALKSIGIPLNGKHPPPIITGNDDNTDNSPAADNAKSLRRKSSEQKLSPVMSCLRSHYGTKPTMKKSVSEIFSMVEYEKRASKCSENGSFYKKSPMSPQHHSHHKKSHSLANETLDDIMEVVKARRSDSDRSGTLIRRSYKSEANLQRIPELLLKQDCNNSNGSFSFSARSAKGLAQRQKSGSRIALTAYSNHVV
ncbi:LysM and putative peptidoglycan-binding domain-containing protein 2 [Glycine soja]|nr:LysM and putative peptidoglycan-binding domain-containing protein 2 [Glycine max]